jgi:hypothetical protein
LPTPIDDQTRFQTLHLATSLSFFL